MKNTDKINFEKLGNLMQVASLKEVQNVDGTADGLREIICKNGRLSLNILAGRTFDIGELSYGGINISYIGKNGLVSPAYAYNRSFGYPESFIGGFLMTCGLDNIGSPMDTSMQHGRLPSIPAMIKRKDIEMRDGKPVLVVEGEVTQAALFGENLCLARKYEISESSFQITDKITNKGFKPANIYTLYHFNFGHPFLSENVKIDVEKREIFGHSEKAKMHISDAHLFDLPDKDFVEECFYYSFTGNTARAVVLSPDTNLKASMQFSVENLPWLVEWKNPLSGEYVLGIEPSSSRLDEKTPILLGAGQSIENSISVAFEQLC